MPQRSEICCLRSQNSGLLSGVASKATEIGQKSWGGISQFVKSPSLQGLGTILQKAGYEDMATPNDGLSNDSKANFNNTGRFDTFEKPSVHAGDAFFSLAETGVERKNAPEKKATKASPGSSVSPTLHADEGHHTDSTITQFEASFNRPRRPAKVTEKPDRQSTSKDWDDDAWAILNN
ncbi:unnamed protein product [Heligmosomoides polygyrus]|uniref:Auxin-responsive protein n=1 Tax=Heligmosomoides polygyrus TaxID=6339 RepID=A0A3P8ESM6_HELPZ|nr:unnamed protein product [Heligmosomoides polygyrus]